MKTTSIKEERDVSVIEYTVKVIFYQHKNNSNYCLDERSLDLSKKIK